MDIEALMAAEFNSVLNGKKEVAELIYVRPAAILAHIESIGGTYLNDFVATGETWNYYFTFKFEDVIYYVSGDGYSGNYSILGKV